MKGLACISSKSSLGSYKVGTWVYIVQGEVMHTVASKTVAMFGYFGVSDV